jgi:hypothetical protein
MLQVRWSVNDSNKRKRESGFTPSFNKGPVPFQPGPREPGKLEWNVGLLPQRSVPKPPSPPQRAGAVAFSGWQPAGQNSGPVRLQSAVSKQPKLEWHSAETGAKRQPAKPKLEWKMVGLTQSHMPSPPSPPPPENVGVRWAPKHMAVKSGSMDHHAPPTQRNVVQMQPAMNNGNPLGAVIVGGGSGGGGGISALEALEMQERLAAVEWENKILKEQFRAHDRSHRPPIGPAAAAAHHASSMSMWLPPEDENIECYIPSGSKQSMQTAYAPFTERSGSPGSSSQSSSGSTMQMSYNTYTGPIGLSRQGSPGSASQTSSSARPTTPPTPVDGGFADMAEDMRLEREAVAGLKALAGLAPCSPDAAAPLAQPRVLTQGVISTS